MGQRGYKAQRGRSYREIETIAQALRSRMGLSPTDRLPGVELFENLDQFGVTFDGRDIPLNYGVSALPGGVEAQAAFHRSDARIDITLSPETYGDLEADGVRARFSLPHELGHVYLHTAELVRLSSSPHAAAALQRGASFNYPVYQDTEWQADVFAASLLMPGRGLEALRAKGRLTPSTVQQAFGVSRASAEIRCRVFQHRGKEIII